MQSTSINCNRQTTENNSLEWYLPDNERTSLFFCLINGIGTPQDNFIADRTDYMDSLNDLEGLLIPYLSYIMGGDADPGELELFTASKLYTLSIEVKTVDADCKVVSTFVCSVEC
ncbi:Hypothetical protein PHPALM_6175 [Phytophthora palmivora]|uniref:Uncharacterized protein n=1 Tax=Phytophthora palmivora TaxID=4796 RepID=A0A2P4YFJ9_9STRA|nr:Hypothetical protein PHPALM_6175 [Phytophthora palmivora]